MEEAMRTKPFAFRRRFERVDWRKLASVNLDQIARDLDFDALQENLTNIAFCNVELELDLRLIDPNFVKLFRMAQLTIEYLLYSQEYLSDTIISLEGRIKEQNKNEENLTEKLRIVEKELERMKKEGHKRKKLLMDQQHLIDSGADNFHKCLLCPKAFMNVTFLQNHCVRRHGQTFQDIKNSHGTEKKDEIPPKIFEQLQEIKERLIFTESQLSEERKSMKELSVKESSQLADRDAKHMKKLEEWQEMRESQHKQEIERIQNMLMTELREMQEKQTATQKALEAAQQGIVLSRHSNLGTSIHDDIDVEREMLQREREEVMKLREQIKLQMDNMQDVIQSELAVKEKEWRRGLAADGDSAQSTKVASTQQAPVEKQQVNGLKTKRTKPSSRQAVNQQGDGQDMTSSTRPSQGVAEDFIEKKKKTLTFADESNGPDPLKRKSEKKVIVPEIRELPPTESTLSSEQDLTGSDLEDDTTLADASTTNQSMSTLGTLDLTGKSKQLRDAITQNPKLMEEMKRQLQQVFNNELMRWDVHPDSEGLNSTKLASKLQHLSQERNKLEKKYKMFRETRNVLIKRVDEQARADAKNADRNIVTTKGGHSPKDSKRLTGTMSSLTATMESSSWGTTSSKWTSSDRREQVPELSTDGDGSSSEEDEALPTYKSKSPSPKKDGSPVHSEGKAPAPVPQPRGGSQSSQAKESSGWTTVDYADEGGFAPSSSKSKPAIQMPGVDAEDSEWDEDDLSDLEELGEGVKATPLGKSTGSTVSTGRTSGGIKNIAANIESQLLQRKGKAPVGGVNTLEMPSDDRGRTASPTTPDIPKMDGSDDDFSLSSVEAQLAPNTGTNTYSSRQWGQGSHGSGISTAALNNSGRPGGTLIPGGDKASSVTSENASLTSVTGTAQKGDSGSDWSADSDFDNL